MCCWNPFLYHQTGSCTVLMRFCKGNRVEIQSSCGTTKGTGEVIRYIDYPPKYNRKYVQVKLDSGRINQYREESLRKIG